MALRDKLNPYAPRIQSILRIVSGLAFLEHGTGKFLGFPALPDTFAPGSPPWLAGWIELICGALIALGLLTRPAAFLASGTMAVGYFMVHAPMGFFPVLNYGEPALLYCFVFLFFVFAGPGPWSVDAKLGKDR